VWTLGQIYFIQILGVQACQVGLGLFGKNHEWLDKWDWKANLASSPIALETLCLCRQGSKTIFQHHSIMVLD
jgi:hypothetical protein